MICAYCHQWLPGCTCAGFIDAEPASIINLPTQNTPVQMGPRHECTAKIEGSIGQQIFPKSLDDKGRCCGRKPIDYKGGAWNSPVRPQKFCTRCSRAYDRITGEQLENWAHGPVASTEQADNCRSAATSQNPAELAGATSPPSAAASIYCSTREWS